MDKNLDNLLTEWNTATANAPWGVQKVFHDVFVLASEGKTTLVYGSDYREGFPCLVNTVGTMLKSTDGKGGSGLPMAHFHEIVSLFDQINSVLETKQVNTRSGFVSPLAADVFLQHFAVIGNPPESSEKITQTPTGAYVEPTDEEMARDLAAAFLIESPVELTIDENNFQSVEVNPLD